MDPQTLLDDWLAQGTLRHSTRDAYRRDVTSWLTWCTQTGADPWRVGIEHVAAWARATHLREVLGNRPLDGPDVIAQVAEEFPEVARSHDRYLSALTQYYLAAVDRGILTAAPDLTMLRTGLDRDAASPRRLNPMERAVLLTAIGGWGKDQARHWRRDRLIAYLLLEGLRPAEVTRVDIRHVYEMPDFTYELRAPDYEFEAVGKQHVLEPLTSIALKEYLPHRIRPREGVHALIIGQGGDGVVSRYPNMLIRQIAATHPLLAQRTPPVTADAVAHTGYWDTPPPRETRTS